MYRLSRAYAELKRYEEKEIRRKNKRERGEGGREGGREKEETGRQGSEVVRNRRHCVCFH